MALQKVVSFHGKAGELAGVVCRAVDLGLGADFCQFVNRAQLVVADREVSQVGKILDSVQ